MTRNIGITLGIALALVCSGCGGDGKKTDDQGGQDAAGGGGGPGGTGGKLDARVTAQDTSVMADAAADLAMAADTSVAADGQAAADTAGTDTTTPSDTAAADARAGDGGKKGTLSFFVTSTGSGAMGGNLGGLVGADAKCKQLATAVGAGDRMWRAYLSTSMENARDRIGKGPWFNAKGAMLAANVEMLHPTANPMSSQYEMLRPAPALMIDEKGMAVPRNQHDILTGSNAEGKLMADTTCKDWTSSAMADKAQVGHTDIPSGFSASWNAAHTTPGCTQSNLAGVGGAGRLYCFAAD